MPKELKEQALEQIKREWIAQLDPAFIAGFKDEALTAFKKQWAAELKTVFETRSTKP